MSLTEQPIGPRVVGTAQIPILSGIMRRFKTPRRLILGESRKKLSRCQLDVRPSALTIRCESTGAESYYRLETRQKLPVCRAVTSGDTHWRWPKYQKPE